MRISTAEMTRAAAVKAADFGAMRGYHIADSKEIVVLRGVNNEVENVLQIGDWIITSETGVYLSGPCELLENGERRPMYDKPWDMLSAARKKTVMDEFWSTPESKRAWEHPGRGPVLVGHYFGDWALDFYAGGDFGVRGRVIWVQDAPKADALQEITHEQLLRKARTELDELKTFVRLKKLENR